MILNLLGKNSVKILALFLLSPGSRHQRKEIKEKTKMNNIPLDKTLIKLTKLGFLKEEKNLYLLNPEETEEIKSIKNIMLKDFKYSLNFLPLGIFYILIEIAEKLSEIREIKQVLLFGSYAKLVYSNDSDVDLAIVLNKETDKNRREKLEKKISKIAEKQAKKAEKQIELHFFTEDDMKAKDPLIKEILRNGREIL